MPSPASSYVDAWRRAQLTDRAVRRAAARQAARESNRRWPLYPTAGMLWRTGTVALQQERKDADGQPAWQKQLAALQSFTDACSALSRPRPGEAECAICLGDLAAPSSARLPERRALPGEPEADAVLLLPCDPSHAFHSNCLTPWLKCSFNCPICRADLRPLLSPQVAGAVAESIRAYREVSRPEAASTSPSMRRGERRQPDLAAANWPVTRSPYATRKKWPARAKSVGVG